ncbi:MAG: DUF1013 domain-containing protein [bacterium]|nr:DUF1013 domain-containing protein [bacterium]
MADTPLMPKATAVWLVENTSLTFEQIADFCGLHMLEVKGIADDDVAQGIKGMDPISSNQLKREEIEKGQKDAKYNLKLQKSNVIIPASNKKTRKRPKYVPVSKRQDRPNAIVWLVRNHPELKDPQIIRLVGTTKPTIEKIKKRTHTNISNFQPVDPVALGLCTQTDLDNEVEIAAARIKKEGGEMPKPAGTLLPTAATTAPANVNPFDSPQTPVPSGMGDRSEAPSVDDAKREAADVFANFPNRKEEEDKSEGDDKAE